MCVCVFFPKWLYTPDPATGPKQAKNRQKYDLGTYRSSEWRYRQRHIILELIMRFIADTDTGKIYVGVKFL